MSNFHLIGLPSQPIPAGEKKPYILFSWILWRTLKNTRKLAIIFTVLAPTTSAR